MLNLQHIDYEQDFREMDDYYFACGQEAFDNFRSRHLLTRQKLLTDPTISHRIASHPELGKYDEVVDICRLGLGEKPKHTNFIYNFISQQTSQNDSTNYILALKSDKMHTERTMNSIQKRNETKLTNSKEVTQ